MDLPPPPPPDHYRYATHHNHHYRDLHPFPPPPPPLGLYPHRFAFSPPHEFDLPPPPPPPRVLYPHRFAFSPPHEFDLPPPPPPPLVLYPHRFAFSPTHEFDLPPPPPNRDYYIRSPNFRDDVFIRQRFIDDPDLGNSKKFRDTVYRDDVIDRGFGNVMNRRGDVCFSNEGHRFDHDRFDYEDERRLYYGLRPNDDRRVRDFGVSDNDREFYREGVENERRRGCGVNERGSGNDERRFDRFSGRLGRRVCDEDVVVAARDSKKRRVQREFDRVEVVGREISNKRKKGKNHFESNNMSVRGGKGKEVVKVIDTRGEEKKEREQSPLELAISFESNGLVARAILTPSSSSAGKTKMDLTPSKDSGKVNGSLLSKFEMDVVKVDGLNNGLDAKSGANVASESNACESGKLTTNGSGGGENVTRNGNFEDLKAEGAVSVGSQPSDLCRLEETKDTSLEEHLVPSTVSDIGTTDVTSDVGVDIDSFKGSKSHGTSHVGYWRARTRRLRKMMRAKKKRLRVSNLGTTHDGCMIMIDNPCSPSEPSKHDANVSRPKTNEMPGAVILPSTVTVSKKVDHESEFGTLTESLVYITKDADFGCQPGKDDVACSANEAIFDGGNTGDGLVVSERSDGVNICVPNSDLELNSDNIRLRTDRDDDFIHCSLQDRVVPPKYTRKRKASYDQSDLSYPKTKENLSTLTGIFLSKDCSSSERVDLPCESSRCEENESSSEGPSEDGSSYNNLDVGSGLGGLSCKKKKIDSSGLTSMFIDGFHRDQSELDWGDPVLPDCGAGRWKDAHTESTTAINICDATDIDIKGEDNISIAEMDNVSSHEEMGNLHVNGDELNFVDNLSSDKNVGCNAYSGDEQAESDSDELSCPSSPEDLLLFSDFSSPINTNISPSLSRNDIIYRSGRTFNRRAVSAEHLGKANSYNAHTNRAIPSPVTFPMVQKSNFTDGKLMMSKNQPSSTASKAFTGYPQKCSTPKTLPSTQVSKSKTWCRTGSAADTTLQLKPSLPFYTTKMSGPTQNSYVRKCNSLTRTPSSSSAPSPVFHASNSSVYRASPSIDGLKKCQSFKTTVDTPSLQRKPSPSSVISPGFRASSSMVYRASPSIDGLKKSQSLKTSVDAPSLLQKPSRSSVISPGFHASSSFAYRASPSIDGLKKGQAIVDTPSLPKKASPSSDMSPGFHPSSSSVYRASPSIAGLSQSQAFKTIIDTASLQRKPSPSKAILPGFHTVTSKVYRLSPSTDSLKRGQTPKNRVDGDVTCLHGKPLPSSVTSSGFNALRSSVYRLSPSNDVLKKGQLSNPGPLVDSSIRTKALALGHDGKSPNSTSCDTGESLSVNLDTLREAMKSSPFPECRNSSNSKSVLDVGKSEKKITYVKRKSNQLVAASDSEDTTTSAVGKTRPPLCGGYYKSKKNQLVRTSLENQSTTRDPMVDVNFKFGSQVFPPESSRKRQFVKGKGFQKTFRSSKFSLMWKLHEDAQSSGKHKVSKSPQKVLSRLFPWKRATYRRSFMLALGLKPNNKPFSISQKLLLSRKRGAVYTRSSHGYSLKMSKVFSVGGSSLKWSKSLEKNSKKVNEDAIRAVAGAEKTKKEENITGAIISKTISRVSRKLVPYVKLRPGERIFRIGSERYKMDPTRRTLRRITEKSTSTSSAPLLSEKNVKTAYVPRRLFIGSNEYVRIANGNQLVRDPKKRTRVLASEKVRWSLRTARLSWAKKKKYCQFFTKFGKCNREDGKCPYIHDQTKIVVCTKFLNGSCSNPDCKLTHKIIPERMQDCSYFLKGSCSSDNCPYRHANVDPDSPVCESFLRGYCADGNECRKKHTYICPAFEATGTCLQASTCKLHHPKKKTEKKPVTEEKIVRGRYFDGGLSARSMEASENVFEKGKDKNEKGTFPDFISLDVSDDEMR